MLYFDELFRLYVCLFFVYAEMDAKRSIKIHAEMKELFDFLI